MAYSELSHTEVAKAINHLVAALIADSTTLFEIRAEMVTNNVNSLLNELMKHAGLVPYTKNSFLVIKPVQQHVTEIITLKRKSGASAVPS